MAVYSGENISNVSVYSKGSDPSSNDVVVTVGGVKVKGVRSIDIKEILPDSLVIAKIEVLVSLGKPND